MRDGVITLAARLYRGIRARYLVRLQGRVSFTPRQHQRTVIGILRLPELMFKICMIRFAQMRNRIRERFILKVSYAKEAENFMQTSHYEITNSHIGWIDGQPSTEIILSLMYSWRTMQLWLQPMVVLLCSQPMSCRLKKALAALGEYGERWSSGYNNQLARLSRMCCPWAPFPPIHDTLIEIKQLGMMKAPLLIFGGAGIRGY